MKNLLYLAIVVLAGLSSCVDLDRAPYDAYSTSTFFKTEKDALTNLAAVYSQTNIGGFFSDTDPVMLDCITDNGYCPHTNQLPYFIPLGSTTPSSGGYVNFYNGLFNYTGIRHANFFLENIDKVVMDETAKATMRAEVRFLRAFNYGRMMMYFGGVPLVTKVINLGEENIPRSTEKQIADFVNSELAMAIADLPKDNVKGRVDKGTALAFKARFELFIGDFANAEKDAKAVMDLQKYGLFNSYAGVFLEKNQGNPDRDKEVIYEIPYTYTNTDYQAWIDCYYTAPEGGWSSADPTQSLVDAYETTNGLTIDKDPSYDQNHPWANRDPRLLATVLVPGTEWNDRIFNSLEPKNGTTITEDDFYASSQSNRSKTGYNFRKYCAPASEMLHDPAGDGQGLNQVVIRYSEVLLTYAEALIEQNKSLDLAAKAINDVRARVNMPAVTETDQAGLRERVRRERRVELAFEGLRWCDIKRWKIGAKVLQGPVFGVRTGKVNMTNGEVTFTGGNITVGADRVFNENRDYYFPIPQKVIDLTPAVTQNPNW
jgi:SusD family.